MVSKASKLIDEVLEERQLSKKEEQHEEIIEMLKEIRENTRPSVSSVEIDRTPQSYNAGAIALIFFTGGIVLLAISGISWSSPFVVSLAMLLIALILMITPGQKKVK